MRCGAARVPSRNVGAVVDVVWALFSGKKEVAIKEEKKDHLQI
jgi:hypothetical protein